MIDWAATKERCGYTSKEDLTGLKRPIVVCLCDNCKKSKEITVRVKSRIINEQMDWLCPSCVGKKRGNIISAQMNEYYSDNKHREERKETTYKLLQDPEFKRKQRQSTKEGMKKVDMSTILFKRYNDPAAREKLRIISKNLWKDDIFRLNQQNKKQVLIKEDNSQPPTNEPTIDCHDKISITSKKHWQCPIYREKVRQGLIAYYANKANRLYASEIAKQLWKDERFRDKVVTALRISMTNPETISLISETSKDHWTDENYRQTRIIDRQ